MARLVEFDNNAATLMRHRVVDAAALARFKSKSLLL